MRIYSESSLETLRAGKLVKEWADDGFITPEQRQRLEQDTVSDLRTTNIFLRLVLGFFTLVGVGAATALFFDVILSRPSQQTSGVFFLFFAAACYAAAEVAVDQARLYRYGIEEALAVCSIGFLAFGVQLTFFSTSTYPPHGVASLVPALGAVSSLWIWHRFGLWYAFPIAMLFVRFLPIYWTSSLAVQLVMASVLYAAGLVCVARIRSRPQSDLLDDSFSLAEAFLWLGIYLTLNLKISAVDLGANWWGTPRAAPEVTGAFYWATWVLSWCLPPLILARGIRKKERFVMAAGAIAAILTFITNKPYLGWQRHTWDPMLLGLLLTGVAVYLRRWLAKGPGGVRHGFTAASMSGKDEHAFGAASSALGLLTPQSITPAPQKTNQDFHFGGGGSGGGGADF